MNYTLGLDIGSSSVKASLLNLESGKSAGSAFFPKREMSISVPQPDWAEQAPEEWWKNVKLAIAHLTRSTAVKPGQIKAIGITYQMHGLVAVDRDGEVVRPSIIWCDSRAIPQGEKAFKVLGREWCLRHLLNSPGNFTASKLSWIKENEPQNFERINKIMLPGDYIAYRLTGEIATTLSGLSEGVFIDFQSGEVSGKLLEHFGFQRNMLPQVVPVFGVQGQLQPAVAAGLGMKAGIPVAYRAGDQPNNAFSLNVLMPGEVAANAGTSGVVYGVSDQVAYDEMSRVNTFAHVNHTREQNRLGILLCINGTAILNAWLRQYTTSELDYEGMNELAATAPAGSAGLMFFPFGNGSERMLQNANPGAMLKGLHFNIHRREHLLRAAQEGIAHSFRYGIDIMHQMGVDTKVIRAGMANMFLSPLFRQTLSNLTGATIELYDTDGALGAARGAALGAGLFRSESEAFRHLNRLETVTPGSDTGVINESYDRWKKYLDQLI